MTEESTQEQEPQQESLPEPQHAKRRRPTRRDILKAGVIGALSLGLKSDTPDNDRSEAAKNALIAGCAEDIHTIAKKYNPLTHFAAFKGAISEIAQGKLQLTIVPPYDMRPDKHRRTRVEFIVNRQKTELPGFAKLVEEGMAHYREHPEQTPEYFSNIMADVIHYYEHNKKFADAPLFAPNKLKEGLPPVFHSLSGKLLNEVATYNTPQAKDSCEFKETVKIEILNDKLRALLIFTPWLKKLLEDNSEFPINVKLDNPRLPEIPKRVAGRQDHHRSEGRSSP